MDNVRENRVNEVWEGVESYSSMAGPLSAENPLAAMALAQWILTLLHKLVDWGALTEEEHSTILLRMVGEIKEKRKELAKKPDVGDDVQALIDHIGI